MDISNVLDGFAFVFFLFGFGYACYQRGRTVQAREAMQEAQRIVDNPVREVLEDE